MFWVCIIGKQEVRQAKLKKTAAKGPKKKATRHHSPRKSSLAAEMKTEEWAESVDRSHLLRPKNKGRLGLFPRRLLSLVRTKVRGQRSEARAQRPGLISQH